MYKYLVIFLFICITTNLFSQQLPPEYHLDIKKGDSLFAIKDYKNALVIYLTTFKHNEDLGLVIHRYRTAVCWAINNNNDSAFMQLQRIATRGKFDAYEYILQDSGLINLHNDPRWLPVLEKIRQNKIY